MNNFIDHTGNISSSKALIVYNRTFFVILHSTIDLWTSFSFSSPDGYVVGNLLRTSR